MGKQVKTDRLAEAWKSIDELTAENKLKKTKIFKLEQALKARDEQLAKLQDQLKSLARPDDTIVEQLKCDNRELRAKVALITDENATLAKSLHRAKMQVDDALEQLKKYAGNKPEVAAPPA